MDIISNLKLISSGNIPTTENLAPGEAAFGIIDGKAKIFGNVGNQIVDLTGISGVNTVLKQIITDSSNFVKYDNEDYYRIRIIDGDIVSNSFIKVYANDEITSNVFAQLKSRFVDSFVGGFDIYINNNNVTALNLSYEILEVKNA